MTFPSSDVADGFPAQGLRQSPTQKSPVTLKHAGNSRFKALHNNL